MLEIHGYFYIFITILDYAKLDRVRGKESICIKLGDLLSRSCKSYDQILRHLNSIIDLPLLHNLIE